MFGFVAKEGLYLGLVDAGATAALVAAVIGNALMLAVGFQVALNPFTGPAVKTPRHAHEGPLELWAGPVVLGACGVLAGLFTHATTAFLVGPAAAAVAGRPVTPELHLVPTYISTPLILSVVTIAAGALLWWTAVPVRAAIARVLAVIGWTFDRGFDQVIAGIVRLADAVTRLTQTGEMHRYVLVAFGAIALALLAPMALFGEWPSWPSFPMLPFHVLAIIVLTAGGLVTVLIARTRLTAIVALGIQGFGVAVIYMLAGAPDLSFTQFMVETLSVVILTLAMTRLSLGERDHRPVPDMIVHGALAIAIGAGFMLTLLAVVEVPFDRRLTDFFDAYARTIAHGRNIVNVIIVDFRGLDTLGEIAVVMITGVCILALVRVKGRKRVVYGPEAGER
jgi:multicomponent Na+:H+ antiporter subunit A